MPEGDTIFRAATQLRRWLGGREVTAARSRVAAAPLDRIVGSTVDAVEPRAKHLLIRFSSGHVLHTHMRMTGSWHVYRTGEPWQRPERQAKVVVETGDRLAVCFNAPVVELLRVSDERRHPSLVNLGPDVLGDEPLDLADIRRRAAMRPPEMPIGDVLLDQRVVSGIGNIYRCESLFLEGLDPWTPRAAVPDERLDALVLTAQRLMAANAGKTSDAYRTFGPGDGGTWVYDRAGRDCRRCAATIEAGRLGRQARLVFWCPRCQPRA